MFQLILQATLFQWCFHYEIQSPELNKMVEGTVKHRYNIIARIRENIAGAESAGSGNSIFEYGPLCNEAKD